MGKLCVRMYSETCLVSTSKGTQNHYFLSELLTIRVGYVHSNRDKMRSTYYPEVCTKPGTY